MAASFHPLKVRAIRREGDSAVSVDFEVPGPLRDRFRFRPGQHLTLQAELDGEDLRRNYSICSSPQDGELRVAIKRQAGGRFSTWANEALAVGDSLGVMPPHGSFTWDFSGASRGRYAAFAAGSGITPILSLIKTALAAGPDSRFALYYGNRTLNSVMFLEELAALKNRYMDRVEIFHFLSAETEDVELLNGRLDGAKVSEVLQHLIDPAALDAVFVCGPGAMMAAARTALVEAGVADSEILLERFTAAPLSEEQAAAARQAEERSVGRKVQVKLDGRRRSIAFDPARGSILENARAAGMPAPFACKAGVCATCRAKVIRGEVAMTANFGLNAEEVAQGYVLTCQAVPLTDDVLLDYDA